MGRRIRNSNRQGNAHSAVAMQEKVKAGLTLGVGLGFMLVLLWFLGGVLFLVIGLAFTALAGLFGLIVSTVWVRVEATRRGRRREARLKGSERRQSSRHKDADSLAGSYPNAPVS